MPKTGEMSMRNYQLITCENAKSPIAEAYRTLRTNLQFANAGEALRTVMYTSSGPGEGKSTTVANTAVVLAQSGKKVIIIDCGLPMRWWKTSRSPSYCRRAGFQIYRF
jgi:Mrp family chromosome partitioning ATPase